MAPTSLYSLRGLRREDPEIPLPRLPKVASSEGTATQVCVVMARLNKRHVIPTCHAGVMPILARPMPPPPKHFHVHLPASVTGVVSSTPDGTVAGRSPDDSGRTMPCDVLRLLLTAGLWTPRVFATLSPKRPTLPPSLTSLVTPLSCALCTGVR